MVVPLELNISLRAALCPEGVLDLRDLVDVWEELLRELVPIVGQDSSRWAIGYDPVNHDCFRHKLSCNRSE